MVFFSFIVLVVIKLFICVGILLFLILFSPILLFGGEESFLRVINKLHELISS